MDWKPEETLTLNKNPIKWYLKQRLYSQLLIIQKGFLLSEQNIKNNLSRRFGQLPHPVTQGVQNNLFHF